MAGGRLLLEAESKIPVRVAFVLVDGFNLHDLSRALAILNRANSLSASPTFELNILTLDDRFAVSSWGVSVVPSGAVCSAGPQDYMFLCVAERPTDSPTQLYFLLRHLASEGGVINLISPERETSDALVPNALNWLVNMAVVQGVDCDALVRLEKAIAANKLYALTEALPIALVERHCGTDAAPQVNSRLLSGLGGESIPCAAKGRPKRLDEAIRIMVEHLDEPLTARELGRLVGCSSRQLLRWFDAHLSTTPAQYFATLRLEHGRHLLFHSDMSVTEIAVACGYQWVAQFSKAYRKRYGQSPRNARKSLPRYSSHDDVKKARQSVEQAAD